MNFSPFVWGPSFWKVIHYVALSYPENPTNTDKENYKLFFSSLKNVLPCDSCKNNMSKHIKLLPLEPYLDNNRKLFRWTVQLHNMVNKETNKKEISYNDTFNIYLNDEIPDKSSKKIGFNINKERILIYIGIALVLLFFINKYFFSKKRRR